MEYCNGENKPNRTLKKIVGKIKKFKKMKKIILVITAIFISSLVFFSCTNTEENQNSILNDEFITKLTTFNESLKIKQFKKVNIVSNSNIRTNINSNFLYINNNAFENYGKEILRTTDSIENHIESKIGKIDNNYLLDIKPYIDNKLSNFKSIKDELNNDEKYLIQNFIDNYVHSIDYVLAYEKFFNENSNINKNQIKNFFIMLSRLKHIIYYTDSDINYRRTFSAWETCVIGCMRHEYAGYNVVNWVQFALSPGADVLWGAASCGWDCRKEGYWGN
jgi:hypothetical protein